MNRNTDALHGTPKGTEHAKCEIVGQNNQQLLRSIPATVALALLYAPLFPAAAGGLPKRTALQPLGQLALIDPSFGIIMRILVYTVLVAARAMAIA